MKRIQNSSLLFGLIGLAWCFAWIALYFVSHKPFTPELATRLVMDIGHILAAFALVSLGGAIGHRLLSNLELPRLTALSLQSGLGLGILGLGVLLVGWFTLSKWILWAALLLLSALFWRPLLAWWKSWGAWGTTWRSSDGFSRSVLVMLCVLFLFSILVALAPPVTFDALMYHLVMPNAYLNAGHVTYLPWLVMTGMPQTGEMLYTWVITLGGNSAAAVLSWFFSLLAVMGLFGYLDDTLGRRAAAAGCAALMAGYTLAVSPAEAYIDWLGLFFGLGTLVCLDLWRRTGQMKALIMAAAFAGMALGTKYPAGVLGLVSLGALCWHTWKRHDRLWPALWRFGLVAGLVALPWFVKNTLATGNPIYPFFLEAGAMNTVRTHIYQGMLPWGDWQDFFLLPLRATYLGLDGAAGYSVSIGPLLLGLGALAWVGWGRRSPQQIATLENAAVISILGLLVWMVGNRMSGFLIQTRFYFALFPAFTFLAAAGFDGLSQLSLPQVRLGRILSALILFVLGLNVLQCGIHTLQTGSTQYALGMKTEKNYLEDNLGWYAPAMQAIRELPPGSKTLLLFETRSLYCQPVCTPDEILDRWKRTLAVMNDPRAILQSWRDQGFTHVLFYNTGAQFMRETGDEHYNSTDWQALDQFLATLPKSIDYGGTYTLYDIR